MTRHRILVGVPSSGSLSEASSQASWLVSLHHDVDRMPSCMSAPNFNACWMAALQAGMEGKITRFAMIHADLQVLEQEQGMRWGDILNDEMEKADVDFISVPMAIKDGRRLTSSGIGNPCNRWNPFKRFTVKELAKFPQTFTARDTGWGDKYLLHNHALCMWDMTRPFWYHPDENGACRAIFNFTELIQLINGRWCRFQDSEDWAYSRDLWRLGARTAITRRITTIHIGTIGYDNKNDEAGWEYDHDTASQWKENKEPQHA